MLMVIESEGRSTRQENNLSSWDNIVKLLVVIGWLKPRAQQSILTVPSHVAFLMDLQLAVDWPSCLGAAPKVPDRFADSLCEKGSDSERNLVIDDFFDRCDYLAPGRSPSLRTSFARLSERRARDLANGAFDDSNQSGRKVRAQWLNQFYASRT